MTTHSISEIRTLRSQRPSDPRRRPTPQNQRPTQRSSDSPAIGSHVVMAAHVVDKLSNLGVVIRVHLHFFFCYLFAHESTHFAFVPT